MPVLLRLADDASSRIVEVYPLRDGDNLIGRGVGMHITLVDESISRTHARVVLQEGRWILMTLNTANPVRIGGRGIGQVDLHPGTEFQLGTVPLRFELADPRHKLTVMDEVTAGAPSVQPSSPTPIATPSPQQWVTPEALVSGRQPPPPTPTLPESSAPPQRPGTPRGFARIEPEAARGSWLASPPGSDHLPPDTRVRVEGVSAPHAVLPNPAITTGRVRSSPPPGPRRGPPADPGHLGAQQARPPSARRLDEPVDSALRKHMGARTESALRAPARWPWVMVGLVASLGFAALLFRDRLERFVDRQLNQAPASSSGDAGQAADTADPGALVGPDGDFGPTAVSAIDLRPLPALIPPAIAEARSVMSAPNCDNLSKPDDTDELAAVLRMNGPPDGLTWSVDDRGAESLVLDYGQLGQHLRFEKGVFAGGVEDPTASTGPSAGPPSSNLLGDLRPERLRAGVDPRCLVAQFGPAHLLFGGAPIASERRDLGVPIAWYLEAGGSMITMGDELRFLSLGGRDTTPKAAPSDGPVWLAHRPLAAEADSAWATLLIHESTDGLARLEWLQHHSTAQLPSLSWDFSWPQGVEGGARVDLDPSDLTRSFIDADLQGPPPVAMALQLGPVVKEPTGQKLRSFSFAYTLAPTGGVQPARPIQYTGVLVATPWRVEAPT